MTKALGAFTFESSPAPHPPLSPNQADDNPMGDIGKKISDFFSNYCGNAASSTYPSCYDWQSV